MSKGKRKASTAGRLPEPNDEQRSLLAAAIEVMRDNGIECRDVVRSVVGDIAQEVSSGLATLVVERRQLRADSAALRRIALATRRVRGARVILDAAAAILRRRTAALNAATDEVAAFSKEVARRRTAIRKLTF